MFIGRLKASPEDLVLVSGKQMFEMWEKYYTPMQRGLPADGEAPARGTHVVRAAQGTGTGLGGKA
jgi:hypothetical protein